MPKQVRSRPLRAVAAALTASLVAMVAGHRSAAQAQPPMERVPVTVAEVVEETVAAGHTFVGTVEPLRVSTVGSPMDGRVNEFYVREGDYVEQHQPIAQLRTKTVELELAAATAELQLRQHELAELENGSRPEEIEQAKARLAAAKPLMDKAQSRYQRILSLHERNAISAEELEEAHADAEAAEQHYLEAKATLDLVVAGPRKERIEQARARMLAQQEVVNRLQDILDRHTIVAPFDGYVIAEHTEVGHWLTQGAPVAEFADLKQVDVSVLVLEDYIRHVAVGTPARVELGALHDEQFVGQVALIIPQADVRSRSFPVKVRIDNSTEGGSVLLKAGMFARVTLPVGRDTAALLVPKDALVLGGPTPLVHVVDVASKGDSQGTTRPVPVELGVASEGAIEVRASQLAAGQYVVTEGNERLMPGQQVQIVSYEPRLKAARTAERSVGRAATTDESTDGGAGGRLAP